MIFQHTYQLILDEKKTQTRRLVRENEVAVRGRNNRIDRVQINGRDKWRIGTTYAVQKGRSKPQIARIELIAINSQLVQNISTQDALAEGFNSRAEFFVMWRRIHGESLSLQRVWVLHFVLVGVGIVHDDYVVNLLTAQVSLLPQNGRRGETR